MILFSYNPKKPLAWSCWVRWLPLKKRLNNFGDLLGPIVISKLLEYYEIQNTYSADKTFFSVGSVLHFANNGDVVWGTGRNGKVSEDRHTFTDLDVRATRGPLTKRFLEGRGLTIPKIYGDPALLLPELFPELKNKKKKTSRIIFVPNYNDRSAIKTKMPVVSPTQNPLKVIDSIRGAEFVAASSLHGIIVADALGVPCRAVSSRSEGTFKYMDYFLGTGRNDIQFAPSPEKAEDMGTHEEMKWSSSQLLSAFPYDLFYKPA